MTVAPDGASGGLPRRSLARSVLATLKTLPPMPEQLLRFESFPAHHLRTNAFMAERTTVTDLRMGALKRKMDAYALESGRNSLRRQFQRLGLRALVLTTATVTSTTTSSGSSVAPSGRRPGGLLVADTRRARMRLGSIVVGCCPPFVGLACGSLFRRPAEAAIVRPRPPGARAGRGTWPGGRPGGHCHPQALGLREIRGPGGHSRDIR